MPGFFFRFGRHRKARIFDLMKPLDKYKKRKVPMKEKGMICISGVPTQHLQILKRAGLNISGICRDAIADAVDRLKRI